MIKIILLAMAMMLPNYSFAHGGRVGADGCHNDRMHGGRHCHSGYKVPPSFGYRAKSGGYDYVHHRYRRSSAAKNSFKRSHPCPSTGRSYGRCPGYVIDHIQALKHGGADEPFNMQWQTISAAKAKDRWE